MKQNYEVVRIRYRQCPLMQPVALVSNNGPFEILLFGLLHKLSQHQPRIVLMSGCKKQIIKEPSHHCLLIIFIPVFQGRHAGDFPEYLAKCFLV